MKAGAAKAAPAKTTQGGEMKEQNGNVKDQHATITQEELRELVELEKVKIKAERLRTSIRKRVLEGTKVEPGELEVSVRSHERVQLTVKSIHDLLGILGDEIVAALPKQSIFKMCVGPNKSSNLQAEPQAVVDPSTMGSEIVPGEESGLVNAILSALQTVDTSESSMQKEEVSLATLVKLKTELLEYAKSSDPDCFSDTFSYEEEVFLESFGD